MNKRYSERTNDRPTSEAQRAFVLEKCLKKEGRKRKKNREMWCSRSMKSYWGSFGGRVSSKECVPFGAHKGAAHMSTCHGQRERQRERDRGSFVFVGEQDKLSGWRLGRASSSKTSGLCMCGRYGSPSPCNLRPPLSSQKSPQRALILPTLIWLLGCLKKTQHNECGGGACVWGIRLI